METKVIVMTPEELAALIAELKGSGKADAPASTENKRYVYGIRGIRDLFNVSQVTAQKYKDTFLQPAVMQRGRKIIVDADMAMQLYNQRANA